MEKNVISDFFLFSDLLALYVHYCDIKKNL